MAFRKNTAETDAKHSKILSDLLTKECNKVCVDCNTKGPRWASVNLGVFLCIRCSGLHRQIGVGVTKVRSTTLDTWTPDQIEMMVRTGNEVANLYYEARLDPREKPTESTDARTMENFIRNKYERFKWSLEPVPISEASPKTWQRISGNEEKSSRRRGGKEKGGEKERSHRSSRHRSSKHRSRRDPSGSESGDDTSETVEVEETQRSHRRSERSRRHAEESVPARSARHGSSSSRKAATVGDFDDDFESPSAPTRERRRKEEPGRERRKKKAESPPRAVAVSGGSEDEDDPFGFKTDTRRHKQASNSVEDLFAPTDFELKKWSILDGEGEARNTKSEPHPSVPSSHPVMGGAVNGFAGMQQPMMGAPMMAFGQGGGYPMMQPVQGFAGMAVGYGGHMQMQPQMMGYGGAMAMPLQSGFAGMQMQPQGYSTGATNFGFH